MELYKTLTFYPFESYFIKSPKRKTYWKWSEKDKLPKKTHALIDKKPVIHKKVAFCAINGERVEKKKSPVKVHLNGQLVFNATYSWHQRAYIVSHYHKYFEKAIREQLKDFYLKPSERLHIEYLLDYPTEDMSPDIDNMWLIPKIFHDTVRDMALIKDDSKHFINGFSMRYIDEGSAQRNLIINIYKYES